MVIESILSSLSLVALIRSSSVKSVCCFLHESGLGKEQLLKEIVVHAVQFSKSPEFAPSDALWIGDNSNRGLGVFSFGQYRLAQTNAEAVAITYVLPARVIGPRECPLRC